MLAARLIESGVLIATAGTVVFGLWMLADLLRVRGDRMGPPYRGGIGHWSWAFHRLTGVGVIVFLFAHIVDTFTVGFGAELYDETIALYHRWWFKPFEVALIAAVLFHALNGLRIIAFDFWPVMALRQKQLAAVQFTLFVAGLAPVAFFMLRSAWQQSPFS